MLMEYIRRRTLTTQEGDTILFCTTNKIQILFVTELLFHTSKVIQKEIWGLLLSTMGILINRFRSLLTIVICLRPRLDKEEYLDSFTRHCD